MKLSKSKRTSILIAALLYLAVALIVTFPAVFSINRGVIGAGGSENLLHLNLAEWFRLEILKGDYPRIAEYHGFPSRSYVIFFDPITAWSYTGLRFALPPIASFNLALIANLALAGVGAFLLTRYLTGRNLPSFIAGLIYAFNPYMISLPLSSGVSELIHIGWIPLFILFILKTLREAGWGNPIAAGVCFFLSIYACSHHIALIVFWLLFFVVYCLFFLKDTDRDLSLGRDLKIHDNNRSRTFPGRVLPRLGLAGAIALILSLHPLYGILKTFYLQEETVKSHFADSGEGPFYLKEYQPGNLNHHAAFLIDYLRPGKDNLHRVEATTVFHRTTYLGFIPIILALIGIGWFRRRFLLFWASAGLFFIALTLGPYLIFNRSIFLPGPYSPFYLFGYYIIPLLRFLIELIRLVPMVMLSLALLAGYGFARVSKRWRSGTRIALTAVLSLLILGEYLVISPAPFPVDRVDIKVPQVYRSIGAEPGRKAILGIPFFDRGSPLITQERFYFQLAHWKPISDWYAGINPNYRARNPLFAYLAHLENPEPFEKQLPADEAEMERGFKMLAEDGYGYIVLNRNLYNPRTYEKVRRLLDELAGPPEAFPEGRFLYRLEAGSH